MANRAPDPRPTDPPFLFCMLLAARKAGDCMLESLARDWLAEVGIRVVLADPFDATVREEGDGRNDNHRR